jgi:hypothetical protein
MAKIDTKIENTKGDNTKSDSRSESRIDLDAMSIEDLATLRDNANAKLLEKVAARQVELEAEMDRLSQYGKPAKKAAAVAAPVAPKQPKKNETKDETKTAKKSEEPDAAVAEAA